MRKPDSPFPPGPSVARRSFVRLAVGGAFGAWIAAGSAFAAPAKRSLFSAYPFQLGVASGDPAPDGFVLWTRLAPKPLVNGGGMAGAPVEVSWQVAEDESFAKVVRSGTQIAQASWGHSVHVETSGLRPDRWYWYRFFAAGEASPIGRTRTAPAAGASVDRLRFAFASCQHFETGLYTAYEHMRADSPDLVFHLGDYIYEGAATRNKVRAHLGGELHTLDEYRNRYALYRSDPHLQAMHAAAPWVVTWDDHEVDNNYANATSEELLVTARQLLKRRAAAYQAYYENMPLRRAQGPAGPNLRLFRRLDWGRLAQFSVLDTRQYRTNQPCGDGQKAPCADSLREDATILGSHQRDWLFQGLARREAQWSILAQQVMMARVDRKAGSDETFSMDQWPGYEADRRRVLRHFRQANVNNPVVLTGDIHTNWANELGLEFDRESEPVAVELVGTSISSGGDGEAEPKYLPTLLSENPSVKFHNAERGYVRCEVTQAGLKADFRTVPYVTKPGASCQTRRSFTVEPGRARLLS